MPSLFGVTDITPQSNMTISGAGGITVDPTAFNIGDTVKEFGANPENGGQGLSLADRYTNVNGVQPDTKVAQSITADSKGIGVSGYISYMVIATIAIAGLFMSKKGVK